MSTTAEFAALARASHARWSTLRFTIRWPGDPWRTQHLRAWLRRPDRLRVETVDGELVKVVRATVQPRPSFGTATGGIERDDAPMYRDYYWVALLDPVELADGVDPEGDAPLPGTEIESVELVEHSGRPAWQAIVRPTPAYAPRCTCCALLRSREVDVAEAESGAGPDVILDEYPSAYRVRLDARTGVCVLIEPIGVSVPGSGHELRIEAVDEPMGDELFPVPPRPEPRLGWSPYPGAGPAPVAGTSTPAKPGLAPPAE